jgi:hypothetical protein
MFIKSKCVVLLFVVSCKLKSFVNNRRSSIFNIAQAIVAVVTETASLGHALVPCDATLRPFCDNCGRHTLVDAVLPGLGRHTGVEECLLVRLLADSSACDGGLGSTVRTSSGPESFGKLHAAEVGALVLLAPPLSRGVLTAC